MDELFEEELFEDYMELMDERNELESELEYYDNECDIEISPERYMEIQDRLEVIYDKMDELGF